MFLSDCVCVYKDAVYIELAGSHALEDEGATPTNAMVAMVTSMQGAELPLDSKMEHAAVSLLKVYNTYTLPKFLGSTRSFSAS